MHTPAVAARSRAATSVIADWIGNDPLYGVTARIFAATAERSGVDPLRNYLAGALKAPHSHQAKLTRPLLRDGDLDLVDWRSIARLLLSQEGQ